METHNLIRIETICESHNIENSFINSLEDLGLIEVTVVQKEMFISQEQLYHIERIIRLHHELNINLEGIDTICNLLERISYLEDELRRAKNKLQAFNLD